MVKNELLPNDEAIKNLLIVLALKNRVDPKIIEIATGIAEKRLGINFL